MATERDFELLDDYLTNRLSEQDKSAFEQQLQADPDLKNEYTLQQKLVKGIQEVRKAELKSMLNNVPVPAVPHSGASLIAKLAVGTILTGAVATGVYLYFNQDETTPPSTVIENKIESPEQESSPSTQPETTQPETSESNNEQPAASGHQEDETEKKPDFKSENEKQSKQEETPVKQPVLDVYDPSAETETGNTASDKEATVATDTKTANSALIVEVDRQNKKYTFHYQFKEGKLFLYGPFERNLYEIIEIFSDKRTAFLYYKEAYYLLNDGNDKIKELTPITDQTLINKLKEYRKK